MSNGAKKMMQSTLDQWVALEKLSDTAREVLPEDEGEAIGKTVRNGATRTLHRLDERRKKTPRPTERREDNVSQNGRDESGGFREVLQVLERQAE